jgi:putative membrane protein
VTSRWVSRLLAEGSDPDPRFTLANERTFLAWIRTSLALLAAGIGLEAFLAEQLATVPRRLLAALLIVLGGALAVTALTRWMATERALRHGRSLPVPLAAPVLAIGISLAALVLLLLVVVPA